MAVPKQLAGRLDERRQRSIRTLVQEPGSVNWLIRIESHELCYQRVDRVRSSNMDAGILTTYPRARVGTTTGTTLRSLHSR